MRSGFTYKGRHSSEFGITAKTKSRPLLPEMKSTVLEAYAMDGVYDFSEANEYGHAFYSDRFFEIQIQAEAENLRALEKKVSKIAQWLKGSGELKFDDMPFVMWKARVTSELGFVPELRGKKTVMTAVFRAEPFSFCVFNSADGPTLDLEAELDSNIPIDVPRLFTWTVTGGDGAYEKVTETLRTVNIGNVETRPIIKITGAVKNVSLSAGGRTLTISASGDGFIADCKRCVVTDLSGKNVMGSVSGEFFELSAGACDIEFSAYVSGEAQICVEYEPRFVYDCDFDDVDWGESNA